MIIKLLLQSTHSTHIIFCVQFTGYEWHRNNKWGALVLKKYKTQQTKKLYIFIFPL